MLFRSRVCAQHRRADRDLDLVEPLLDVGLAASAEEEEERRAHRDREEPPVQFRRGREIVDIVMTALRDTGLAAQRLDLEVTETVLIEDSVATLAILEELRGKEIGVALDDFGTGFASLAYLNDFPFSKIKIDRKFSENIDQSPRTSAIIRGIAQTTRDLRIELVAEGVETAIQLDCMRNFGINAIQGYLFSKPLPVLALRRVISEPIVPSHIQPKRVASSLEKARPRRAAS